MEILIGVIILIVRLIKEQIDIAKADKYARRNRK